MKVQEHTLFGIVKRWSKGPSAGAGGVDLDDQLLSLIGEIRLEHVGPHQLKAILDDPWLQLVTPPTITCKREWWFQCPGKHVYCTIITGVGHW
jgi:hypothetical protein